MTDSPRRCAVLGSPVGHSLSPVLHRAGYAAVGLDWSYDGREVTEAGLAGFLDGLDATWRGLSLTMPLKRAVMPLLDDVSPRAAQAQAANTVILEAGRRVGHNTDITGAATAIRERHAEPLDRATILGGGATAASVLLSLADLGCRQVTLVVRDTGRARETLEAAGRHPAAPGVDVRTFASPPTPPAPTDILVSTIPAVAQTPAVVALAAEAAVVFDVVYEPWPTPLATYARSQGRTLVSGLDLLVHQAAEQFLLMTGVDAAPVEAMRAAGERVLAERG